MMCGPRTIPTPRRVGAASARGILPFILLATLLAALGPAAAPSGRVLAAAAAPTTTASLGGTRGRNGWFTSPSVFVALTARARGVGPTQTYYRVLPAAAYTLYSGPFAVYGQGEHRVAFYSVQGPATEAPHSIAFFIDSVPPVTQPTIKGVLTPSGWYRGTVAITLAPADATSGVLATYWSKDNRPIALYRGPIGLSGSGQRRVTYYSVDRAGNSEEQHQLTLLIDNIPPVLAAPTINGVPYAQAPHTQVGPVSIALGASDAQSGVAALSYRLNGGPWSPYGGPLTIATPGTYTLAYVAADRAGNLSATGSLRITVAAAPIGIASSAAGMVGGAGWYRSPVAVTLTTTPAGTAAQYRVDGGPILPYTAPIVVNGDGHHQVLYRAVRAGSATPWQARDIAIDATPPGTTAVVIAGTAHPSGWYNTPVIVRLDAADAGSGVAATYWQADGQGAYSFYSGAIVLPSAGRRTITYYSLDRAGNPETPHVLAVNIDRQAPTTSATVTGGPLAAGSYSGSAQVALSAVDDLSGVAATYAGVDGAPPTPYAGPIVLTTPGVHTVTFHSVDNAGNVEDEHRIAVSIASAATPVPTAAPTQTAVAAPPVTPTSVAAPTATSAPVQPTAPPADTHRVTLRASNPAPGWDRPVVLSVRVGHDLAGALVILRQKVDGRPWRDARAAILDARGAASWTLIARESAIYVAVVANSHQSDPLEVRVHSVVVLRRVHTDLAGQLVLGGRVWPGIAGHVVALQVGGAHGKWHTLALTLEQPHGLFAFIVPATRHATHRWRVYAPASRYLDGGRSNTISA